MKSNKKTILGTWANDWLNGKAMKLDEEDMQICLEELKNASKEERKEILKELNMVIDEWRSSFALSLVDYSAGNCTMVAEYDELYYTDEDNRKNGMKIMGRDELLEAIEHIGYLNGYHEDAINMAWYAYDMDFLYKQWEDLKLEQIREFKEELERKYTPMSPSSFNRQNGTNKEYRQTATHPLVFGIEVCSTITGYSTSTLYKLTSKNAIPCHRAGSNGRKLFFKLDEILDWLTAREQETIDDYINKMDKSLNSKYNSLCIS